MAGTWEVKSTTTKNNLTTVTAEYKVDSKVVATLSGLRGDVTKAELNETPGGIAVTEPASGGTGTIGLPSGVLTDSSVTLKLSNGGKYTLGLSGTVDKVTPINVTATASNGTVTFSGKLTKGYELTSATTLTFKAATAENKTVKFATLTGLNTSLSAVDGKIGIASGEGESATFTELVKLDATTGVITLEADALAEKEAKLAINNNYSPYKTFALDSGVSAPEFTGSWGDVTSKGASTYTADVSKAGYTLSLDGKTVTFTGEGENVNLATISGISDASVLSFKEDSSTNEDALDANNNRTIVLPASALAQKAVTVSGAGFLLALDDDVSKSDVANRNIWAISGTKAIYKTVKPEYYTYDASTNKVSYTKQADITTLATLNGTKKITGDVTATSVESGLNVGNNGVITIGSAALGTSNLTLTNGKDSSGTASTYTLELNNAGVDAPGVDGDTTWKVSGTTATLYGKTTAGWAKSNDTTITYVGTSTKDVTLATVKGLVKGVALGKDDWEGEVGIAGKDANGDYTFTEGLALDTDNKTKIIVSANVLGTTDVTLTPTAGYNTYSLVLDDGDDYELDGGAVPLEAVQKHFWYIKGKKLLLKDGTARFYDLTDSKTITHHAEVVGKDVATVSGLKTGLKVVDGEIDGIDVGSQSITVSKDVLNRDDVTVTSTSTSNPYKLSLASEDLKPHNGIMWEYKGTNAALYSCKTEGYNLNTDEDTLTYQSFDGKTSLATITGLKSGLKLTDDKTIDGIEVDENKVITLSKNVTSTTDITLNATGIEKGYSLALDGETISPFTEDDLSKTWTVDTNKKTASYVVKADKEGFEEVENESNKVVQLAYKKKSTVTTTISGISEEAKATDFTDPDENGVITLNRSVLGTTNATFSKNPSGYTFALNKEDETNEEYVPAPEATNITWVPDTKKNTTATLQGVIGTPGWELSADALSVVYTPESEDDPSDNTQKVSSVLATVTGLKSGLTAEELNDGGITREGTVLKLSDNVLGASKLTVKGGTYTLAIANEKSTKANDDTAWITSGTTANYKTYKTGYYTPDAKGTTVKYTKPTAGTTYATVKGIAKDVDITSAFKPDDNNAPTEGGEVILTSDMLGTSNVTLTGSGFKLGIATTGSGIVPTSAENKTEWVTNGTTATYKNYDRGYYKLSGNTIKYTKPTGGTTYATIKGIASGATIEASNVSAVEGGNTIVTLNANQLAGKKVTISGSGYELALGGDVDEAISQGTYWTQAVNNASAYYKEDFSSGYTLATAKNAITYSAVPTTTTLATVSGLAKIPKDGGTAVDTRTPDDTNLITGYNYNGSNNASSEIGLTADDTAHTITLLSYDAFGTRSGDDPKNSAKITLKDNAGQGYGLAIDGTTIKAPAADEDSLKWTINKSKRTAVYSQDIDKGVNVSDDKKTLTYAAAVEAKALATISGLDKTKVNALLGDDATDEPTDEELATKYGIQVSSTTIKLLNDNLLGTGKVTLGKNDIFSFDVSAIAPTAGENKWSVKGTTATYSKITDPGYKTTDTKTVTYVKEVVGDPIVTITGLKKGLKADPEGTKVGVATTTKVEGVNVTTYSDGISIDDDMDEVILNSEVFGTTNIQLTNGEGADYTLSLNGVKAPGRANLVWSYSGGTATYKEIQNSGYTLESDGVNVTYTAAKTTTLATVKGLSKTFTGNLENAIAADDTNEIITVNSDILGTSNVTLTLPKNATKLYSFTLGSGVAQQAENKTEWVTSGTTATYKNYDRAYYTTDPNTGAIVYHKPTAGTTYATIKGIKSGVDINTASSVTDGTVGGTITLTAAMLGTSNVSVSVPKTNSSATYTLALANDVSTSAGKATGWVTVGSNAYYRKEYDKAVYALNEKGVITYTKGKETGEEIATIKGANGDITTGFVSGSNSKTFQLSNEGLSNKITLATTETEGEPDYAFNFNNTYNNAAITGSANADTITAKGGRLTVTGGAGNDTITFEASNRGGNVFIYSKNDGDDVIANFKANDSITTKSVTPVVEMEGSDAVISFGSVDGSITLKNCTLTEITINNKSYETGYTPSGSNVLLEDNNYSMDAANLSSIVKGDLTSYNPYDFTSNFSLTKEDKLTPQISYSGNNK